MRVSNLFWVLPFFIGWRLAMREYEEVLVIGNIKISVTMFVERRRSKDPGNDYFPRFRIKLATIVVERKK